MKKIKRIKLLNLHFPLLILIALITTVITAKFCGLVINITPSMPLGLYKQVQGPVKRGDIVLACLTNPHKELGLRRHYLLSGFSCEGSIPLIKKVIAVPGDDVVLGEDSIIVNGVKYSYKTYSYDTQGRALQALKRGKYRSTSGYWLIGTHDEHSWDSRYWGPVARTQIISVLTALILW